MMKRTWKRLAAWCLIAVLCAGSLPVSASGIGDADAGAGSAADTTGTTDTEGAGDDAADNGDPAGGETEDTGGASDPSADMDGGASEDGAQEDSLTDVNGEEGIASQALTASGTPSGCGDVVRSMPFSEGSSGELLFLTLVDDRNYRWNINGSGLKNNEAHLDTSEGSNCNFRLTHVEDEWYGIKFIKDGGTDRYVDVSGKSTDEGAVLHIFEDDDDKLKGDTHRQFAFFDAGKDSAGNQMYYIKIRKSGLWVGLENNKIAKEQKLVQTSAANARKWYVTPCVVPKSGGEYKLMDESDSAGIYCEIFEQGSIHSASILWKAGSAEINGMLLNTYNIGTYWRWMLTYVSKYDAYMIESVNQYSTLGVEPTGNVWDVTGESGGEAQLHLWDKQSKDRNYNTSQLWRFIGTDEESLVIQNARSGKYVYINHEIIDGDILHQGGRGDKFEVSLLSRDVSKPYSPLLTSDRIGEGASWMADIPDTALLSSINMPGSHDTGTGGVLEDQGFVIFDPLSLTQCQKYYYEEQLTIGIRSLDVRCSASSDTATAADTKIIHGSDLWTCYNRWGEVLTLEEILDTSKEFLGRHPSETIVMMVGKNGGSEKGLIHALADYISKNKNLFWHTDSHEVPTMGEARGKIVLVSRIPVGDTGVSSIDSTWFGPQLDDWDDFDYGDTKGLVNISSDSGYKVYAQDAYNELRGKKEEYIEGAMNDSASGRIPGDAYIWNYTSSALLFPQEIAREINPWLYGYNLKGRLGMVMLNYADIKTSRKIYETNDSADFFTADCTFPTALEVTYGDTMAEAVMSGQKGDGTFSIAEDDRDYKPTVADAGTKKVTVCFTPSDARMKKVEQEVTLTSVRPKEIAVTVPKQTFTYGQEIDLVYDVNEAQLVQGDTAESLRISVTLDTDKKSGSGKVPAGEYGVKCSADNANYKCVFTCQKVTVAPKTVTLTWSNTTNITVGKPDQETWDRLGADVKVEKTEGKIEGDDCSVSVTGGNEKEASWTRGSGEDPKKYTAHAALTGADAGNYQIAEGSQAKDYYIRRAEATDYVLPDSATVVYGQKLEDAVLNGASGDGEFIFYDSREIDEIHSIEDIYKIPGALADNVAPERVGDIDEYGIWFQPTDKTKQGSGRDITVTVLPKPVTIQIEDASRPYGDSAAYTYDEDAAKAQLIFDDSLDEDFGITLSAKDRDGNPVTETTPVGTYFITGMSTSTKYDVTFQTGKLTISRREAELSWSGYENLTYKPDSSANVTASVTNVVPGDTCNVTVVNGAQKNAGTYTAVAVKLDNDNYKLTENSGLSREYTIAKATPVAREVTAALTYGQTLAEAEIQGKVTDPSTGGEIPGSFAFGEESASAMPGVADSGNKTYTLTFYPDDGTNYNQIQIEDYQLTVSPKAVTVQMLDREKIYGDELSADAFVSYDETELVGTDTLTIMPVARDAAGVEETLNPTYIDAGTYTVTADPAQLASDNPNYAITVKDSSLTVQQRPVVLEWSDVTDIVYQYVDGELNAEEWAKVGANVTASITNLVTKENGTDDDCSVTVEGGNETELSRGGTTDEPILTIYYAAAVSLEGADSGNYTFSEELPDKPWDITKAYQSSRLQPYVIRDSGDCIFPAAMVMTYGESFKDVRMLAGSGDGTFQIVDEDDQDLKDRKLDAGTYQDTYKVKFTPEDKSKDPSYSTGYITLVVRKSPLTVTAEDAAKTYGEGKPEYTWEVSAGELAEGDKLTDLLTVKSVIYDYEEEDDGTIVITGETSGDKKTSDVNVYDIVLDKQLNENYDLTFVKGKLTINPKEISVVWSDTSDIVYGYVDGEKNLEKWQEVGANVTAEAEGLVNGDACNLTCSGGNRKTAGTYRAIVTGLDNPNYCLPVCKTVKEYEEKRMTQYEIQKADPEAVFPEELKAYKGDVLGGLSFEASADVPGTFTFEAADTVLGESGTYKMIFTPQDQQNYNTAEAMVKVTVSERPSGGNGGAGNAGGKTPGGTKTSDNNPLLFYMILMLLSFSMAAAMVSRKKRR